MTQSQETSMNLQAVESQVFSRSVVDRALSTFQKLQKQIEVLMNASLVYQNTFLVNKNTEI